MKTELSDVHALEWQPFLDSLVDAYCSEFEPNADRPKFVEMLDRELRTFAQISIDDDGYAVWARNV